MVTGLDKFRETFSEHKGKYALIGGVACGLLIDNAGLLTRATKDFDIVLIIEAMDEAFGNALWDFVKSGDYEIRERSTGEPEFYRFRNPKDSSYPKEIELFSRKNISLKYEDKDRLTPIHISEDISSLSAILLNDEYYSLLTTGLTVIDDVQILSATHIIPFKAKAWLDLKDRNQNGEHIDSKKIAKHKNDVFRLAQLLTGDDNLSLCQEIKNDMTRFVDEIKDEKVNLKNLNIQGNFDDYIELICNTYNLK